MKTQFGYEPIISKSDKAQIMSMCSIHDNVADICGIKTTICTVIWQRDAFGGNQIANYTTLSRPLAPLTSDTVLY